MKKLLLATVLLAGITAPALAKDVEYVLRVDGMVCPFCTASSEKSLKTIDGVKAVDSDLDAGTLTVCADDNAGLDNLTLTQLFEETGFEYVSQEKTEGCTIDTEEKE